MTALAFIAGLALGAVATVAAMVVADMLFFRGDEE